VDNEVLNIFISSCEEELKDERQIAIRTIRKMGFNPISSEKRPASDEPIEKLNETRISNSNIYVGIFGNNYSQPTIEEYRMAKNGKIATLIFKKNVEMNQKLAEFIESIKSASTGNTYKNFDHVVEFQKALKESIIYLVSRDFRKPYAYDKKEPVEYVPQTTMVPRLGEGRIKEVELPQQMTIKEFGTIRVVAEGQSWYSFLDLLLVDSEGKQQWYVNPTDIDQNLDKGIHRLEGEYKTDWQFEIYPTMKPGYYVAFIGLYEDTYFLPTVNRRLLDFKIQSIVIRE
jgi:hypothetical protein